MGFFDDLFDRDIADIIIDPANISPGETTEEKALNAFGFDPAGFWQDSGAVHGDTSLGEAGQFAADPLDIAGVRAEQEQQAIQDMLMESAQSDIAAQDYMMSRINAMYAPYREAATGEWGDYTGMTTGGELGLQPSPQYQRELSRNAQAVNRALAAKGGFHSSGRGAALGDVALQAGQSEAARQYGRQLDVQRMGTGAIEALGGAGRTAGQNVGAAYGNLGQGVNTLYQNYGAQRQGSFGQAANTMYGLDQYLGGR